MDVLLLKLKNWYVDRGIDQQDPRIHISKIVEEFGELAKAINKNKTEDIIDGYGDTIIALFGLSLQLNIDFKECIEVAYNQIKDRKGILIDGMYIKNEDL